MNLTPEGRIFAGLALVVLLAAFNTGLNLLYLSFALMISLLVLSVPAALLALAGAAAVRITPATVVAGAPFTLRIDLAATRRWTLRSLLLHHGIPGLPPVAVERLSGGRSATLRVPAALPRRGVIALPPLRLETRFPFGLVATRRPAGQTAEILVVPALLPLLRVPLQRVPVGDGRSRRGSRTPGEGLIFLGVREHRAEDGVRRIHWKSTARMGRLMVRELEQESAGPAALLVDPETGEDPGGEEYERRIRAAATVARQLLTAGVPVRILPSSPEAPLADPAYGLEELPHLLRHLARLDRADRPTALSILDPLAPWMDRGENPILVTGGEGPGDPGALADRLLAWRHPWTLVLDDRGAAGRLEAAELPVTLLMGYPAERADG